MRVKLKGVNSKRKTLADGSVVTYYYAWKGGRGLSAAKVTPRDAAHLLTAILGSPRVKDSAETVQRYMRSQEHRAYWRQHYPENIEGMGPANVWSEYGIPELSELPSNHSFIDALTVILTLASEGRLWRKLGEIYPLDMFRISVTSPRTHARISMSYFRRIGDSGDVEAKYHTSDAPDKIADSEPSRPCLRRMTEMNAAPILYVGALLAGKLADMPPVPGGAE